MRRFHLGLATVALPVFAFTLFLAGCGKDEKKSNTDTAGNVKEEQPKGDLKVLEPKGGVLKGKIALKGSPNIEELNDNMKKAIEAKTDQKDFCLHGSKTDPITPAETEQQTYRVGDNKLLGNVFVWVQPEKGTFFKVTKDQLEEAKHPVVLRQPHCAFIPHCAVLFTQYYADPKKTKKVDMKSTGQVLEVKNDAEKSHNTNWSGGARNPGGNVILEPGKDRKVDDLVPEPGKVTVKCNIHGWMDAYLRVLDTPYYAVSFSDTLDGKNKVKKDDPKFGTYEITNLPAGKVRVFVWHEKLEWLNKNAGQGEEIEIKEGAPTGKDFEGEAK